MLDNLPVAEGLTGAVAAALTLVVSNGQRAELRRPLRLAVVTTLAAGFGLDLLPGRLVVAALIALVASAASQPALRAAGAAVAVGALAAVMPVQLTDDHRRVVVLVTLVAALAAAGTAGRYGREAVVISAAAAAAAFVAVPDTERIGLVVGSAGILGAAAILWARGPLRSVLPGGAAVLAAMVSWAAAVESRGRPASYVAVAAVLSLLIVVPVVGSWLGRLPLAATTLIAGALALGVGRTAGLEAEVAPAALQALAWTVAAAVVIAVVSLAAQRASNRA